MSETVLVVDDDPTVVATFAEQLARRYDVRTASGGRAALATIDRRVDVVLLDRRMPDLDGDEVLAEIRAAGYTCPVAMVTAVEPDVAVLDLGYDAYVVKPVDTETLLDTVARLRDRADYSAALRRYHALVSTRAALEATRDVADGPADEKFAALTAHIERLERDLETAAPPPGDTAAWAALFRSVVERPEAG